MRGAPFGPIAGPITTLTSLANFRARLNSPARSQSPSAQPSSPLGPREQAAVPALGSQPAAEGAPCSSSEPLVGPDMPHSNGNTRAAAEASSSAEEPGELEGAVVAVHDEGAAGCSEPHSLAQHPARPGPHRSTHGGPDGGGGGRGVADHTESSNAPGMDARRPAAANPVVPAALPPPRAHKDSDLSSGGLWKHAGDVRQAQEALQAFLERTGLHEHLRVVPNSNGLVQGSAACSSEPMCDPVQQTAHLPNLAVLQLSFVPPS